MRRWTECERQMYRSKDGNLRRLGPLKPNRGDEPEWCQPRVPKTEIDTRMEPGKEGKVENRMLQKSDDRGNKRKSRA